MDGTTSKHDWIGYVKTKDLPRIANPKKGYIVNANNRVVPDNSVSDVGASSTSTARAQRITEMIRRQLEIGVAFRMDEIKKIMNDKVDIHARGVISDILKLAFSHKHLLTAEEQKQLDSIAKLPEI